MLRLLSRLCLVAAIILIVIGGFVAGNQYKGNKRADENAAKRQAIANNGHATGDNPSTIKPTSSDFDKYQVAGNLPRYVYIPKIGVQARVKQVGLTKDGAVGAPNNIHDTAWYTGSAKPGQPGAMLIDGHSGFWKSHGIFYDLKKVQPGDNIRVQRGDGKTLNYKVVRVKFYPHDKVDMQAALLPVTAGKPGLNLITCAGAVIKGTNEYDQRVIVFAEQQ
jgi:LPXTG-site transpeptidase (sortase) family protein